MSRSDKVSSTLLKEVSSIIHDEIKDPRLGFITVTDVELTDDLRNAKIYLSILGAPDQERQSLLVLEHAKGFIRKLIAERISLRFVPEIIFRVDKSIEYGMRIEEQLAKIKDEFKKSNPRNKKKG
ncbi:MAG: 30S ribosome-binding factor RbfA [Candidatus Omnitrophota bacterium]